MAEEDTVQTRCVEPECGKLIKIDNDLADDTMVVCPACQTAIGTAGVLREAYAADMRKDKIRAAAKLVRKEAGLPRRVKVKMGK